MTAYYNEIDPFAAQWLRELIIFGHIAPGDVNERSIEDVSPDDLRPYTQCHFFAGIGVWSYALRRAGWPDNRPVWTGSCPCQPFSTAGDGKGFDDERHLWPAWYHLIGELGPAIIFGEQVASKSGLAWLDLVHTDVEAKGYAFAPVDLCAAGVGAPHIRQRFFFTALRLSNAFGGRWEAESWAEDEYARFNKNGRDGWLATDCGERLQRQQQEKLCGAGRWKKGRAVTECGCSSSEGLANGVGKRCIERGAGYATEECHGTAGDCSDFKDSGTGAVNGFWAGADWLSCKDGCFRPVEPGTFPLVNGATARVGRLRGYGNAINAEVAVEFVSAVQGVLNGE